MLRFAISRTLDIQFSLVLGSASDHHDHTYYINEWTTAGQVWIVMESTTGNKVDSGSSD